MTISQTSPLIPPNMLVRTPENQRRSLLWRVAITLLATLAWCVTLFWMRRPAIEYFCVCAFLPFIFFAVWTVLGWQLLTLMRLYPHPYRLRMIAVMLLAFFLGPYSLTRAGSDMFTLSLRYHLWRAGGAEKVQAIFNQWISNQPVYDPSDGRKLIFRLCLTERESSGT